LKLQDKANADVKLEANEMGQRRTKGGGGMY
jgi:hypothetical protein